MYEYTYNCATRYNLQAKLQLNKHLNISFEVQGFPQKRKSAPILFNIYRDPSKRESMDF